MIEGKHSLRCGRILGFCGAVLVFFPWGFQVYAQGLEERVIEHTLKNGMRVLIVERHQAPLVSFNMTYGVGGVNEHAGITGIAHLFEHMAFKGTRRIGTSNHRRRHPLRLHRYPKREPVGGQTHDITGKLLPCTSVKSYPSLLFVKRTKLIGNDQFARFFLKILKLLG